MSPSPAGPTVPTVPRTPYSPASPPQGLDESPGNRPLRKKDILQTTKKSSSFSLDEESEKLSSQYWRMRCLYYIDSLVPFFAVYDSLWKAGFFFLFLRVKGERDGGVTPGDFFFFFSPYVGCSVAEPRPQSLPLTSCQYFRSSRFPPLSCKKKPHHEYVHLVFKGKLKRSEHNFHYKSII